jgi:hypothetical protein
VTRRALSLASQMRRAIEAARAMGKEPTAIEVGDIRVEFAAPVAAEPTSVVASDPVSEGIERAIKKAARRAAA